MNSSRVSSEAIRSSSRWRKRVSTSCRPWCFSGGGRSDFASSAQSSTRSDSSPRREQKTVAVDPDQVAEVEVDKPLERSWPEHVGARVQLDAPGAVDEVEERRLALAAARGDAAGEAVVRPRSRRPPPARRARRARRRSARRPRRRAGTARRPPRAAARAWRGARRAPAAARRLGVGRGRLLVASHRGRRLLQPDVDLRDLELALLAVRQHDGDDLVALARRSAPCRRATRWRACARPGWPRRSRRSCTSRVCSSPGP